MGSFRLFLAEVIGPGPELKERRISLEFLLETRLKSESFEPLIDFLTFLVQKLWQNLGKISFWEILTQN